MRFFAAGLLVAIVVAATPALVRGDEHPRLGGTSKLRGATYSTGSADGHLVVKIVYDADGRSLTVTRSMNQYGILRTQRVEITAQDVKDIEAAAAKTDLRKLPDPGPIDPKSDDLVIEYSTTRTSAIAGVDSTVRVQGEMKYFLKHIQKVSNLSMTLERIADRLVARPSLFTTDRTGLEPPLVPRNIRYPATASEGTPESTPSSAQAAPASAQAAPSTTRGFSRALGDAGPR